MDAVIIMYDSARATKLTADTNLKWALLYLEFIVTVILKHETCWAGLTDEVKLIVFGLFDHLEQERSWLIAPGNTSGHK